MQYFAKKEWSLVYGKADRKKVVSEYKLGEILLDDD